MNAKMIKEIKEESYGQGLNDAWEFMKKCFYAYSAEECEKIFGKVIVEHIVMTHTPQEALAKLKAYEESQSKIEVGDVVTVEAEQYTFVVIAIYGNDVWGYKIGTSRLPLQNLSFDMVRKTGKHIDIESILEQIREV